MNKVVTAIAGMVLAGVVSVQATLYTDIDLIKTKLDQNETYSGTFNIANKGYNSGVESVTSALAQFWLADDLDWPRQSESFTVSLGSDSQWSSGPVRLLVGDKLNVTLLADLGADGILNYSVTAATGDFYLLAASLEACTERKPQQVPDGGTTLALLGLGLVGVAGLRRRMAR